MVLQVVGNKPRGLFVVLLPTLECNLACTYCFEEHPKGRWDLARTRHIIDQILELARRERADNVRLHWQGGEALLMGTDYWSAVLSMAEDAFGAAGVGFEQSMQTNLTLYTRELGDLIKRYFGGQIGTSFEDSPGRCFEQGGHTRFVKAWTHAYARALDDGIRVGVISVLNDAALSEGAESFLNRMRDTYGIRRLRINLPFQQNGSGGFWVDARGAGAFMRDAYRWWVARGRDDYFYLKPMKYLEEKLTRGHSDEPGLCIFAQNCSDVALTVMTNGDVTLCDSFAFTGQAAPYGNVFRESLAEVYRSPARAHVHAMCRSLIADACTECRFLPMCYGGCLVRSHDRDNLDPSFHYCETYKTLFSAMEEQHRGTRADRLHPGYA